MAHKNNAAVANEVSKTNKSNANRKAFKNEVLEAKAPVANEVSKQAENKPVKTQRVLETREAWECIFAHTVTLVATLAKGKALADNCNEGFHFVKVADSPHSRAYAKALLAAFSSNKADKFLGNCKVTCIASQPKRYELASQVLLKAKLVKGDDKAVAKVLTEGEKKQCKAFCEALMAALA